jgi:hypothetical protein
LSLVAAVEAMEMEAEQERVALEKENLPLTVTLQVL